MTVYFYSGLITISAPLLIIALQHTGTEMIKLPAFVVLLFFVSPALAQ